MGYVTHPALRYPQKFQLLADGAWCVFTAKGRSDYSSKVYPELARDIWTQFVEIYTGRNWGLQSIIIPNSWDSWFLGSLFSRTHGEILLRPRRLWIFSGHDWRRLSVGMIALCQRHGGSEQNSLFGWGDTGKWHIKHHHTDTSRSSTRLWTGRAAAEI